MMDLRPRTSILHRPNPSGWALVQASPIWSSCGSSA